LRKIFAILLILFSVLVTYSQTITNRRIKRISLNNDTIYLDTLSIIQGSVFVTYNTGQLVNNSLYKINLIGSFITIDSLLKAQTDSIIVSYRVFPFSFNKEYFHKDLDLIKKGKKWQDLYYEPYDKSTSFQNSGLDKSGSLSRGISFGNQQDAILNSNLNLQLSGKLNSDLNIVAAISDANIPIQPDGSSQQIQDFDKVFIKIFNENNELIAGDFQLNNPPGYFMKMHKKVKGAINTTKWKSKKGNYSYKTTVSGALAKGKYCRKQLVVVEGNQGPYRLQGCENESYIIILSGSEKIYIDGKLLIRGQENDYVINYNTAEITFTPLQPITKDKRVIIEFEYSEQNYARFSLFNSNEIYTKKSRFYFNFYNEQDSKNQTLNLDLNDSQKQVLNNIGDNLNSAYYPNIFKDTVYNENYIYYELKDTIISHETGIATYFDSVFVYSTNPDLALYRLGFSYIGENNGNYEPSSTNTNGKVFRWVAPNEDGSKNGSYEPVILLITPKKKQVISLGGQSDFKTFKANYEFALSNTDLNTFSSKDANDNIGYAFKMDLFTNKKKTKQSIFDFGLNYEFTNRNFIALERYRSPEFERDWNIVKTNNAFNQHLATLKTSYKYKNEFISRYNLSFVSEEKNYNAIKNNLFIDINKKGNRLSYDGSLLNSVSTNNITAFIRHKAEVSKTIKGLQFGVINELENNRWRNSVNDSLLLNSFAFNQWEIFLVNPDSLKNKYFASYKIRQDFLPLLTNNQLVKANKAGDLKFGFELLKNPKQIVKTTITYRELNIQDTSVSIETADNSLLGRIEGKFRLLKGSVLSSTFYEIGTGLESIKEYSFVEVDKGLGLYIWNDYNENNIQELEEFEVASYKDTANYIRVQLPGNYVKVYSTNFNQILNLKPGKNWYKQKGLKKVLSRFSNQSAYRMSNKTKSEDILSNINPFKLNSQNTQLVSLAYSIKNTLSFNRSNSVFGLDYIINKNVRKNLLLAGYNQQENYSNNINLRWNLSKKIGITTNVQTNKKQFQSEAYSAKNYEIKELNNEIRTSYQPVLWFRIQLIYKYLNKDNSGLEKSTEHNLGLDLKYNIKTKGNLNVQFNYLKINFNGKPYSPLAYEMLQGFSPGNNLTWTVQYQQRIAESLQLNINYDGRKQEGNNTLHTGGIQLRALF